MPGKKSSAKRNSRKVSKIRQEALDMKESKAITSTADNGKMAGALDIVNRIIDVEPSTTTKGRFPELWAETREALNHELESQRAISKDIIRMARKTTQLLQVSRENAVENLVNLVDEMESRGDITIPEV